MRNLLLDADRDRLVAPLAGPLAGEVMLAGRRFGAVMEAEGSAFFPLVANARAAELLLMPGVWETRHAQALDLLDFVMALAETKPASRRAVAGSLVLRKEDPAQFELLTPFFRFTGNLARGELRQEPRGAGGPMVVHSGNLVELQLGRRGACVDAEDAITDCAVEPGEGRVVLRHVSAIRGLAGLLRAQEVEAGRLEMRYEIRADSPVLRVTARFTAARALTGLRLTTALDAISSAGLEAGAARLLRGSDWTEAAPPAAPGEEQWPGGLAHLALGRKGWPGRAQAMHLRPLAPERVISVTIRAERPGLAHWLLLRHGHADLAAGETFEIQEDRLFAPGAQMDAVAAAMASGATGLDLDPAPASGAALQAVATALMLDAAGAWATGLPAGRRAALADFAGRQLARLTDAAAPAEIAQAALGADALRRAGVAGMDAVQMRLIRRLAAANPANLAARALALLAHARAASWPDGAEAAAAVSAVLPDLALPGDPAAEAEGVALLARAAGAVPLAIEAGAGVLEGARGRALALHRGAVNLLRPMVRARDGALAVMPRGALAAGPQALATLALLAPDRLAFAAGPVDRAAA